MVDVATLRELFRNLVAFRDLYETEGIDTVIGPSGESYTLWDVEYLYEQCGRLARRQRQAIELYLVLGYREHEAASEMGLSPTNPVGMYATKGLEHLVAMVGREELPRYTESSWQYRRKPGSDGHTSLRGAPRP